MGNFEKTDLRQTPNSGENVIQQLDQIHAKIWHLPNIEITSGQRLFLTTADPGSLMNVSNPLVAGLRADSRAKTISVLTAGYANNQFAPEPPFQTLRATEEAVYEHTPYQIAVATPTAALGPEILPLYEGKKGLGAEKLFFIVDGWGGLGQAMSQGFEAMNPIDAILCNNILAAKMVSHRLPAFPQERILSSGTPTLDSIRQNSAKRLRTAGRKKLGLSDDLYSILYLGDADEDYKNGGYDPEANRKTALKTAQAIKQLAQGYPERKFAFLFRPHPRDPAKENLYFELSEMFPHNVTTRYARESATNPEISHEVSIDEATYASESILSINSTENYMGPLRGVSVVFLAFQEEGLGYSVLKDAYGEEIMQLISKAPGTRIAETEEDLKKALDKYLHSSPPKITRPPRGQSYTQRVTNLILS
jgi:hypothetical protein